MLSRSVIFLCGFLFLLHEIHSRETGHNNTVYLQELASVDEANSNATMNTTLENRQLEKRNCIFRIEEDDHLVSLNKTREEIESEGKTIFDEICEGDLDENGDKINSGALASLCCG